MVWESGDVIFVDFRDIFRLFRGHWRVRFFQVARRTAPETTKRSEVGELVEHRGAMAQKT